jgi:hypothetical protein
MYSGSRGRFTKPDPAGLKAGNLKIPQTLNQYTYTNNDPVNYVDPTGLIGILDGASPDWLCRLGLLVFCPLDFPPIDSPPTREESEPRKRERPRLRVVVRKSGETKVKSFCGGAEFKVKISVAGASDETPGYVIQHAVIKSSVTDGDNTNPPANALEYWNVDGGRVYPENEDIFGTAHEGAGSKGMVTYTGIFKFFYADEVEKDIAKWRPIPGLTGDLPGLDLQGGGMPVWWNNAPGTSHGLAVQWDCTGEPDTWEKNLKIATVPNN